MKVTIKTIFDGNTGKITWLVQTINGTNTHEELLEALSQATDIPHKEKLQIFYNIRKTFIGAEAIFNILTTPKQTVS